mgnify:CR=1 FL=1
MTSRGSPLVGTFSDYLMPGSAEMPEIKVAHTGNADVVHRIRREGDG